MYMRNHVLISVKLCWYEEHLEMNTGNFLFILVFILGANRGVKYWPLCSDVCKLSWVQSIHLCGVAMFVTPPITHLVNVATYLYFLSLVQITTSKLYCECSVTQAMDANIRDLGPSIRVPARRQSKQVNWCLVFTLIRVRVPDFCLGCPCPSSSLHVAISSDADVRVRLRLCNAHTQSRLFTRPLLQATKMAMASDDLGSEPRM